jgi:hypothetical protein
MKKRKPLLTLEPFLNTFKGRMLKRHSLCGNIGSIEEYYDIGYGIIIAGKYCKISSRETMTKPTEDAGNDDDGGGGFS